ncbi:MAG: DUF4340 domain-containing protein [Elusimicrobia bacterium]|nr:DUF4340 domain-containing protein [Elusimicrobiota bacterium]
MPRKIWLGAGLAVLLGAAAALLLWLRAPARPEQPLSGAAISRIEINQDGQELVLKLSGGAWRLEAPVKDEAQDSEVEALVKALKELAIGSEVSREAAHAADYGLDEAHAARVRVYGSGSAAPLLDASFGKEAVGDSVYFRRTREPEVRLAEGVPGYLLRRPAADLRRRGLLDLSLAELRSLRFTRPRTFALEKSSANWTASGRDLSADQAAGIVLALAALRFSDFAGSAPKSAGFDRPALRVEVSGTGRKQTIVLGREEDGRRWAEALPRGAVGFVPKPEADDLLKLVK